MIKQQFPHQLLWLASYPKSGNTWFRAFLTALISDSDIEINKLKTDGIFSDRLIFDYCAEVESRDLYVSEASEMMADVYRYIAAERDSLSIIKIHDALSRNDKGETLVPAEVTRCAVYFIRNPLDIAGSLANHNGSSIQDAVNMLNNPTAHLLTQAHNFNRYPQFRQNLFDWSTHVLSWTENPPFPVCVVRYEDMLTNTFDTFQKIISFIGLEYSAGQIKNAIAASSFETMKKQEAEKGFREKITKNSSFFRKGTHGNWEKELSPEQIDAIVTTQKSVMKLYNYITH